MRRVKFVIGRSVFSAVAVAAAIGVASAPVAYADPDQQIHDGAADYCPGNPAPEGACHGQGQGQPAPAPDGLQYFEAF